MPFSFTDKDTGWNRLLAFAESLKDGDAYVKAGMVGPAAEGVRDGAEGLTNVDVAMFQEFGTRTVPERSFIRSTFDRNRAAYEDMLKRVLEAAMDGKIVFRVGLGRIGARMASDMQRTILSGAGVPPPLAPSTIAAKGSSRPLVDTTQMVKAISYEVPGNE